MVVEEQLLRLNLGSDVPTLPSNPNFRSCGLRLNLRRRVSTYNSISGLSGGALPSFE